ncbi:hypothetical protein DRC29_21220 [Salmonella enterica]|nr:hypothetical protein [Salmonella enterica]EBJ1501911.1 hypothetical protein [Salmonella enterica]EGX5005976.1 hypothetical protein [Salmonella enterica]
MAKYKIIQMGDERGIGSVVQKTGFFGKITTWTIKPYRDAEDKSEWFMDKWVCRENGLSKYREFTQIEAFYTAQYLTMTHDKKGAAQ